jgi:hypothetical protein
LFPSIYRGHWPAKVLTVSSFDLDKNQRVAIAADDIDFASASSAKISVKNLITTAAQKTACDFFTACAAPNMLR